MNITSLIFGDNLALWLSCVLFAFGLLAIIKGGDRFVDAATWVARVSGIPSFIIGATVVSLATTLPEILVSSFSTAQGSVGLAYGNAVGSVTANLGLIMGISLIFLPAAVSRKQFAPKALIMAAAGILVCAFSLHGTFTLLPGVLLLIVFGVFLYENLTRAKASMADTKDERPHPDGKEVFKNVLLFVVGAAGIVVGADLMVENGTAIARALNVSEAIIGATIVAVGTSLPELVTTITALVKKESSLSVGNIIGANVLDLSLILPICTLISGGTLTVEPQNRFLDGPACLLLIALSIVPPLISKKLRRWQGVCLLGAYAVYVVLVCTNAFGFPV